MRVRIGYAARTARRRMITTVAAVRTNKAITASPHSETVGTQTSAFQMPFIAAQLVLEMFGAHDGPFPGRLSIQKPAVVVVLAITQVP